MLRFHRLVLPTILLISLLAAGARAQTTGEEARYPGTTGDPGPIDTVANRELQQRTLESSGLLEGPINENLYHVGPNDLFTISIFSATPRQFDVMVTPEAKIVIQGVAEVDVRGKTLSSAKRSVLDAISRVYRADASVSLKRMRQFKVYVTGAVKRVGPIAATPVTRVSEAIDLAGGATSLGSKRDIIIFRQGQSIPVDLMPFYAIIDRDVESSNPYVQDGDRIRVGVQDPKNVVTIYGAVLRGGEFSYRPGDSISSLIRYSLGFTADAFLDSIDVVSVDDQGRNISRETIRATRDGMVDHDRALEPGDRIFVYTLPKYRLTSRVIVAGEVRYPGSYPIEPGVSNVRDLIASAGGFTDEASISDAVLVRRRIQLERDPQFDRILQIKPEDRTPWEVEYYRVKASERPGVMSISFPKLMAGDPKENLMLKDDDSLYVPSQRGSLKVSGKVRNPGNLTWVEGMNYQEYIERAGGYSWRADEGETQIIKANSGEKFLASSDDNYRLEPGDNIFVPEEPEVQFWKDVAIPAITVIAQVATIIAVIVSVSASTGSGN